MPRVSILLTCYDHVQYLPLAVESIVAQSYKDYEIIAVDDGSKDGTREWLTNCETKLVRLFNEKNLGTYGSLNRALKSATGEFIAILNDDDLWYPQKLERQLALLDANPKIGLVHAGGVFINSHGVDMQGSPMGFGYPAFDNGDRFLELAGANKVITSAAMIRSECFKSLGGFNEKYFGSGDWEMWLRIAETWHLGFVPGKHVAYRVHPSNASNKKDRIWEDDERVRRWLIPKLEAARARYPREDVDAAMVQNYAALGTVLTWNGRKTEGRSMLGKALKLEPKRPQSWMRYAATFFPGRVE